MRRFVFLVSKIRSLRNLSKKKINIFKRFKKSKGQMQRFSVAHAAKKVNTYIHPFFQGIIKKNKHTKITPWKGR